MNKFVLCAIDWENKSLEELHQNKVEASEHDRDSKRNANNAYAVYVAVDAWDRKARPDCILRKNCLEAAISAFFDQSREAREDYYSCIQVQGRIKRSGAPAGNKNARKEVVKDERIQIRCTAEQKEALE